MLHLKQCIIVHIPFRKCDSYDYDKDFFRILRIVCVEGLCETQPELLLETLEGFFERYYYKC